MADGRHIAEYWKRYNSSISEPIWMKLGWSHDLLPSNGALYIQQLRASGGRTHEPILIKFGTQQHVGTGTTVT